MSQAIITREIAEEVIRRCKEIGFPSLRDDFIQAKSFFKVLESDNQPVYQFTYRVVENKFGLINAVFGFDSQSTAGKKDTLIVQRHARVQSIAKYYLEKALGTSCVYRSNFTPSLNAPHCGLWVWTGLDGKAPAHSETSAHAWRQELPKRWHSDRQSNRILGLSSEDVVVLLNTSGGGYDCAGLSSMLDRFQSNRPSRNNISLTEGSDKFADIFFDVLREQGLLTQYPSVITTKST